jgi:hypothetical protein
MKIEELRDMAARWGGNIERWPADVQDAARAIARTPEGRGVLAQERRLDELLARRPAVPAVRVQRATRAVLHRLADQETQPPWQASFERLLRGWLVPTASLACSTALGVALALSGPTIARPTASEVAAISLILDSTSMLGGIETR